MENVKIDSETLMKNVCEAIWTQICDSVEAKMKGQENVGYKGFKMAIEEVLDFFEANEYTYTQLCASVRENLATIQEKELPAERREDLHWLQQNFYPCMVLLNLETLLEKVKNLNKCFVQKKIKNEKWTKIQRQMYDLLWNKYVREGNTQKMCDSIRSQLGSIQQRYGKQLGDVRKELEWLKEKFYLESVEMNGRRLKKKSEDLSQGMGVSKTGKKAWERVLIQIDDLLQVLEGNRECKMKRMTYREIADIFSSDLETKWAEKGREKQEELAKQVDKNSNYIKNWVVGKNFPTKKKDLIIFLTEMDLDIDSVNRYLQVIGDREELYSLNVDEYILIKILQYNKIPGKQRISGEEAFDCIVRARKIYINYLLKSMRQEQRKEDKNYYYLISCYQALSLQLRNEKKDVCGGADRISETTLDNIINVLLEPESSYVDYEIVEEAAKKCVGKKKNLLNRYEKELEKVEKHQTAAKGYYRREWERVGESCVNYLRTSENEAIVKAFDEVSGVSEERVAKEIREITLFMRKYAEEKDSEDSFPVEQLLKQDSRVDNDLSTWLENYGGLFMFEWIGRQYACLEIFKEIEARNGSFKESYRKKMEFCVPGDEDDDYESFQFTSRIGEYTKRRISIKRRDYLKLLLLMLIDPETRKNGSSQLILNKEEHGAVELCNRYLIRAHFAPLSYQIRQDAFLLMCLKAMAKYHEKDAMTAEACMEMIRIINEAINDRVEKSKNGEYVWKSLAFIYRQRAPKKRKSTEENENEQEGIR